jgi:hypothetical protein
MTRWLSSCLTSSRRAAALAAGVSLATVAVLKSQDLLSSYQQAERAYREAAAKAPADERACYTAFADYYHCVALSLGPNPPASCRQPTCTPGGAGAGAGTSGSTTGLGGGGTTGVVTTSPEQEQLARSLEQTFNALEESANGRAMDRNARQRAALNAASSARDAERLRQEQAEAERQDAITRQFLEEMQRTFVPLAFSIKSSPQSGVASAASGAYVQAGIRALDAIDYKTAAARFTDALRFPPSGDDVRLAAASTLVLVGDFRQAAQQLTELQQSADPKYAQQGKELLALVMTRGEKFRWALIENSRNSDDFALFLRDYPVGQFFEPAQRKFFELDAVKKRNAYIAANTRQYDVWHFHAGFGASPSGRLTVAPDRVAYEELGNIANLEHSFDLPCRDIEGAHGNPLGILADRSRLWVNIRDRKTYIFITESKNTADELIALIKNTCSLR